MKSLKPSQLLASAGWLYVFGSAILVVLRLIPADGLTWGLFALFLFIAVFASAVATGRPKISGRDIRISLGGGGLYTQDALQIHELRDGSLFIAVDLSKPFGGIAPDAGADEDAPPSSIPIASPPAHYVGAKTKK